MATSSGESFSAFGDDYDSYHQRSRNYSQSGRRVPAGKDELKNQEWVSPTLNTTADGSLYFSILDLAKWDAASTPTNC